MVKIMTNGLIGEGGKEPAGRALPGRWRRQEMKTGEIWINNTWRMNMHYKKRAR